MTQHYYAVVMEGDTDELEHYGVLGMRWGIRKGRYAETYEKATEELAERRERASGATARYNRLERKRRNLQKKSRKAFEKASKKDRNAYVEGYDSVFNKYDKRIARTERALKKQKRRMDRANRKAERWVKQMRNAFSKIDVNSIPDSDLAEEYAIYVIGMASGNQSASMLRSYNDIVDQLG